MAVADRTPLAWRNLTHDVRRLAVAVCGVAFAVVLIFMELGFLNGLLESTVRIMHAFKADIVMVCSAKYALPATERFDLRRIDQARGVEGVASAAPFYMESLSAVLRPPGSRGYPIRVLAYHEQDDVLDLASLGLDAADLSNPESALVDLASRPKYGIPTSSADLGGYVAELAGKHINLAGHFSLGVDVANDGNLLMSADNFAKYFSDRAMGRDPLSMVDLGLITLQDGADAQTVKAAIATQLPADVTVLTKQELIDREILFWKRTAPVSFIFLVGVVMGFVVGVIICYQIIYSDIADHLREFATLKAMGYTNRYFIGLVLQQAVYLALMGFVPGVIVSWICYQGLTAMTGLTTDLALSTLAMVLVVTIAMCVASGLLAVRKLLAADPAELF